MLRFSSTDHVRHELVDGALFVTVDRAGKRNPLSLGVLDSIRRIFCDAATDSSISVAILTGAGDKAFASGGDLDELADYRSREDAEAFSYFGRRALDAVRLFPVPVIARLNGLALGGGAELALACDLRFAAPGARIGFIHGRLCIAPSWGGGNDLVRLLGASRALHLMVTGRILEADEAVRTGLIDLLCPEDQPFDAWFDRQLSAYRGQPAQVMRAFKSIALSSRNGDRLAADHRATEHFGEVWAHADHWDAVARMERKDR